MGIMLKVSLRNQKNIAAFKQNTPYVLSKFGHVMRDLKCTLDLVESHGKTWLKL